MSSLADRLRAPRGDQVGANPVDRAKPGRKLRLAVEGGGLPLSLLVTGANTNDSSSDRLGRHTQLHAPSP